MLIINANIITLEDRDYENGYIKIENGLISEIGDMSALFDVDEDAVDLCGKKVLPGFIDAHSHIGMWEDGLASEGDDGNEETDPITPQMSAVDAVNPIDHCFSEAVDAGITTVLTGPGSANPISGMWVAMKTYGRRIDDMLIDEKIGMKFSLGENPKNVYSGKEQAPATRMATAALIKEQLSKAQRYMDDIERSNKEDDFDLPEYDAKCEALIPVLSREIKAFFHAHRSDDIFTAIRIAKQFNLDYVLVHATDGYKIADILADEQVKVISGPIICDRSKPELRNHDVKNAGVLSNNGILTAICTDHPVIPIQYLALSSGLCVREGMNYNEALKAITINAAKICGIDDIVGSIKINKHADLVVFDDDPFSVYSKPFAVMIDGVFVRGELC